jgi:hypothetical protein
LLLIKLRQNTFITICLLCSVCIMFLNHFFRYSLDLYILGCLSIIKYWWVIARFKYFTAFLFHHSTFPLILIQIHLWWTHFDIYFFLFFLLFFTDSSFNCRESRLSSFILWRRRRKFIYIFSFIAWCFSFSILSI